ncbi:WD40 repeat-like protein [Pseudovirgaria hyperparasitica]|uniref:WD40 repeat-like protein n=1 Tax=Pseudovirgaria hyperparasitica TaxID=470096 RepID=A0A6A6WBZ3_9PEZI|nr:WD40 repeat-like protein [Pseudovirgaria hyperparasitica]KAF2759366.1 WD40 repeat-like protein [Pseudovirgaria hyperparasitica]
MAHRPTVKTTYAQSRTIQPIYTGGSIDLNEEGSILATCLGEDVLITNLSSGQELARIEGDGEVITSLVLTPKSTQLIICSRSLSMRIYSLRKDESLEERLVAELKYTLKPHTAPVVTTAVNRHGSHLATGGADGIVKIWDIQGGFNTHNFHGHGGLVTALHFFEVESPAVGTEKTSDKRRKTLDEQAGIRLASGAEDGKIRIWNLSEKSKASSVATLDSHVTVVRSIDFSPEENALVSASRDKTMVVWDARTWKPRITVPILESLEAVGFMQAGTVVYTGGENGHVRLWATDGGRELTGAQEPCSETDAIVNILHRQDVVLSVHADQTLVLLSKASLAQLDRSKMIKPLEVIRRISGTHDEVIDLAYVGKDRSCLALATNLEDIRIISVAEPGKSNTQHDSLHFGSDIALLKGHEDIIICLDVDWSGHWLATGAKDNTARLWRLDPQGKSFTCYATFTGHAESLGAIALPHTVPAISSQAYSHPLEHPPSFLITGSQDKTVKRWDVSKSDNSKSSRAVYTRKAHDKDINALDTSPNDCLFASASQDRTVKIWDTESGETIGVLRGHRRGVWTVKFAPTGIPSIEGGGTRGVIATGSGDKTVKIWSLENYNCLHTFEGHSNSVLKVIWLPIKVIDARDRRGAQVASAAGDGLVKIWDTQSGEEECTLDNHIDRVWALTVNPETNVVASGAADSVITFWNDTTSTTVSEAVTRATERVEQDQKLQNLIHSSNYREAIVLALQLNHPARLFSLFQSVVESDPHDEGSMSGRLAVDEVLGSLADEQLFHLLMRLRDWNASAKTCQVAQRILWTIVRTYDAERLASIRSRTKGREQVQMRDLLDGIKAYTERHFKRLEEMIDESFLVDFTLAQMDGLGLVRNVIKGNSDSAGNPSGVDDIIMVE